MGELTFETTSAPTEADLATVNHGLRGYNLAHVPLDDLPRHALFARDGSGVVVGGAITRSWGLCYEIMILWVAEPLRQRGVGGELVRRAEEHARSLECDLIYLDTMSYQAPGFYRNLGYTEVRVLEGFPQGMKKHFFEKAL